MIRSLWIAKTGLDVQQTNLDVVSNNLANASTTGFKRSKAMFEDLIYQTLRQPGGPTVDDAQSPTGLQLGVGARVVGTQRIYTQGNLARTDNNLDIAISGNGFFQIQLPDGTVAYSRDGAFSRDNTGQMVNSSGYVLNPGILIPATAESITIGEGGEVRYFTQGGNVEGEVAGQIQLALFNNPAGLAAIGGNLYIETAASGAAQQANPGQNGAGFVRQFFIESSNVNVAEELVNLIVSQRAYEFNTRAIRASDEMLQRLGQL